MRGRALRWCGALGLALATVWGPAGAAPAGAQVVTPVPPSVVPGLGGTWCVEYALYCGPSGQALADGLGPSVSEALPALDSAAYTGLGGVFADLVPGLPALFTTGDSAPHQLVVNGCVDKIVANSGYPRFGVTGLLPGVQTSADCSPADLLNYAVYTATAVAAEPWNRAFCVALWESNFAAWPTGGGGGPTDVNVACPVAWHQFYLGRAVAPALPTYASGEPDAQGYYGSCDVNVDYYTSNVVAGGSTLGTPGTYAMVTCNVGAATWDLLAHAGSAGLTAWRLSGFGAALTPFQAGQGRPSTSGTYGTSSTQKSWAWFKIDSTGQAVTAPGPFLVHLGGPTIGVAWAPTALQTVNRQFGTPIVVPDFDFPVFPVEVFPGDFFPGPAAPLPQTTPQISPSLTTPSAPPATLAPVISVPSSEPATSPDGNTGTTWLGQVFQGVISGLSNALVGSLNWVGHFLGDLLSVIVTLLQAILAVLQQILVVVESIPAAIGAAAAAIVQAVEAIPSAVLSVTTATALDIASAVATQLQTLFIPTTSQVAALEAQVQAAAQPTIVGTVTSTVTGFSSALVAGASTGMAGSCGPSIGFDGVTVASETLPGFRIYLPSGPGCTGNGPGGSRTTYDVQAWDLDGYRDVVRGLAAFALVWTFMWSILRTMPWSGKSEHQSAGLQAGPTMAGGGRVPLGFEGSSREYVDGGLAASRDYLRGHRERAGR